MVRLARLLPLLLLVTALLQGVPATAQEFDVTAEAGFVEAINASRATQGLAPLAVNDDLTTVARGWSSQLAVVGSLSHNPSYTDQYPGEWRRLAENVGTMTWAGADTATLVDRLHRAFMDSAGHRANILGDYNQLGVGVVTVGPTMWVTVNFLQGPVPVVAEPDPVVQQPTVDQRLSEAPWPVTRHYSRR